MVTLAEASGVRGAGGGGHGEGSDGGSERGGGGAGGTSQTVCTIVPLIAPSSCASRSWSSSMPDSSEALIAWTCTTTTATPLITTTLTVEALTSVLPPP